MTMALTGKVAPYKRFRSVHGSVYHAPYPSELQGISTADSLKAIERLFKADIDPTRVAAIIFEPVQAKGASWWHRRNLWLPSAVFATSMAS